MARRRLKTQICVTCSLIFTGDSCYRCAQQDWLTARTRKGSQCSNCGLVFTVDRGDGKRLIIFPNGGGGTALYVVCRECGGRYQELGLAGLPNVARDSKITVFMSPYAPQNAPKFVH